MNEIKTVADSKVEQVHLIMPGHTNGLKRLFGGQLLSWIDEVAGIVARRHAECTVVTACIDNLQFLEGVHQNDLVVIIGKVTYVSNSSIEVRVDTYDEKMDGIRKPINRAYFVMVALDEEGKPVRVPRLQVETESEKAEWEGGILRSKLRKERRKAGY